ERSKVGGELVREHREILDAGVDGGGLAARVAVDGRASVDGRTDVGDTDADADAGGRALRPFDLIEVARGVVIDGRPQQIAHVAVLFGQPALADGVDLAVGAFGKIGVEAAVDHFLTRGGQQIDAAHLFTHLTTIGTIAIVFSHSIWSLFGASVILKVSTGAGVFAMSMGTRPR